MRFVAYGASERVFGWVRLQADRLTDLLNGHAVLLLTDAEVEDLEHGTTRSAHEVQIRTRDLVAVHASGPRGAEALRRRTRSHPVAIRAGSYLVGGHLHAPPGDEPLTSLRDRPPMVPLTDAWIEYWSGGVRTKHATGTIIVNRDLADWVRVVTDEELLDGVLGPPAVDSQTA